MFSVTLFSVTCLRFFLSLLSVAVVVIEVEVDRHWDKTTHSIEAFASDIGNVVNRFFARGKRQLHG